MTPEMQELKDAYEALTTGPYGDYSEKLARAYVAIETVLSLAERDDADAGQAEMDAQARQDGDEPF